MHLKFSAERRDAVEVKRERDRNMIFHQTLFLRFYEIILKFPSPTPSLSTFSVLPAVIIILIHQQLVGLSALAGPMVQAVVETTFKKQPTE